jgi:hypothetical protein
MMVSFVGSKSVNDRTGTGDLVGGRGGAPIRRVA